MMAFVHIKSSPTNYENSYAFKSMFWAKGSELASLDLNYMVRKGTCIMFDLRVPVKKLWKRC